MNKGIYPGSFDPLTFGHIDMIERGAKMFDELIIGVAYNQQKKYCFTLEERIAMLKEECSHMKNIKIVAVRKLTVDFAKEHGVDVILRGLRAVTDFEYELQMASTNRKLDVNVETIFMMTNINYSFLSSSIVKEIASLNGDISKFVPPKVGEKLKIKFNQKN